ncbi:hypothetical protein AFGD_010050 [Aspergillus flavus]|nr:hypothetical protein AFGD_010050 [Aspergillus flavus]
MPQRSLLARIQPLAYLSLIQAMRKFQPAMIMKQLMSSGMWQKKILHNLKERTEGPVHGSGNASQKEDVYVAFAIHVELLDILKAVQYFQSTIVKEISCWGECLVA